VQQRHERLPPGAQDRDEGWRRDDQRALARGPRHARGVARRRPGQQLATEHRPRRPVAQDEGRVGKGVDRRFVVALGARGGRDALAVQLGVDRVGPDLAGVQLVPEGDQAVVVPAPAQRARPVPGGHRGGLVEEEQLGEAARLQQRRAVPAAEAQPAGDPAPAGVAAADVPGGVVQAATVAVDQAARGIGDQLAQRRDPVAPRHDQSTVTSVR